MNAYYDRLNARIETALLNNCSTQNEKKLTKMRDRFKSEKLVALLEASNVDAEVFDRAIYASEKLVNFAMQAIMLDHKSLNAMTLNVFLTAMRCAEENETLTIKDVKDCMSAHRVVSDERAHLVVQRRDYTDESTIHAQHQTSLDALRSLNIVHRVASNSKEAQYAVNFNEIAQALYAKFVN